MRACSAAHHTTAHEQPPPPLKQHPTLVPRARQLPKRMWRRRDGNGHGQCSSGNDGHALRADHGADPTRCCASSSPEQ
jgi:hypothetical protein